MKRFWFCIAFTAVLFTAAVYNTYMVESVTASMVDLLNRAEEAALSEEWDTVEALTTQAKEEWDSHENYFSVVMVHALTDDVTTEFEEVMGFLQYHSAPEYDAANGTLVAKVEHLAEVEALNWKNIL